MEQDIILKTENLSKTYHSHPSFGMKKAALSGPGKHGHNRNQAAKSGQSGSNRKKRTGSKTDPDFESPSSRQKSQAPLSSSKDDSLDVQALRNVSLEIPRGQFAAVTGASGSGKSTLLHILAGIDQADAGAAYIDGQDITSLKPVQTAAFRRQKIGIVYQAYNLIPTLSVEQNILLPLKLDGRKPDLEFLHDLAHRLGIEHKLHAMPAQLSGGQAQRAAIARALITRPAIVLADEPTGNLDRKNSQEILDLLKLSCKDLNQTILMITHDESLALQTDRILVMEDGQIVQDERLV